MRRSSQNTRGRGFALVELIISLGLVVVVSGAALLVFWTGIVLWQRHEAESATHLNSTEGLRQVLATARHAVTCRNWVRGGLSDALELVMPADTDSEGNYVPVWEKGKLEYREGERVIFYLSDETGAYDTPGEILWRATIKGTKQPKPATVVPDANWSLYYDTGQGRIAGIETMDFEVHAQQGWVRATLTARAQQGDRIVRREATGTAYLWNHNVES